MEKEDPISLEIVVLTTEGIGLTLTKKKLAACLPVLKKMLKTQGDTWVDWQRKEIHTGMTAEALSVFINFVEQKRFTDFDRFHTPKLVLQLLKASDMYEVPELWQSLSINLLKTRDTWFQQSTVFKMLDVVIKANCRPHRPNTRAMAKKLLEWLATDIGFSWKSFDMEQFISTREAIEDEDRGDEQLEAENIPNLFPKDYVLVLIAGSAGRYHKPADFLVNENDTVWDLKQRYAATTKHPVNELRFIVAGRQLKDSCRISEYKPMMVDIVYVVFRLGPPSKCVVCNPNQKTHSAFSLVK